MQRLQQQVESQKTGEPPAADEVSNDHVIEDVVQYPDAGQRSTSPPETVSSYAASHGGSGRSEVIAIERNRRESLRKHIIENRYAHSQHHVAPLRAPSEASSEAKQAPTRDTDTDRINEDPQNTRAMRNDSSFDQQLGDPSRTGQLRTPGGRNARPGDEEHRGVGGGG